MPSDPFRVSHVISIPTRSVHVFFFDIVFIMLLARPPPASVPSSLPPLYSRVGGRGSALGRVTRLVSALAPHDVGYAPYSFFYIPFLL